MSSSEKVVRNICKWGGILGCILAVLILSLGVAAPRYKAVIQSASDMWTSYRATRSRDENWKRINNRYVTIEYEKGTVDNVRIKRQPNEKMPGVGDTIIICDFPRVREYDPVSIGVKTLGCFIYGICFLVIAFRRSGLKS